MTRVLPVFILLHLSAASADAQNDLLTAQDLKRLTIEELAEIDVTSVSRRTERLSETAAALSVLRDVDIARAGATTLADAMRLAGAVDVARIHGNAWAVSARGFTISTANKLLVLIDGRTVYSPLFSGTFWDAHDLVLADIDRIEVIRGPGGTIWGANAVNGVINIITKDAAATRGTAVNLTAGSMEHFIGSVRHGGRLGAAGSYRVWGKFRDRGAVRLDSGASAEDSYRLGLGGVRLESSAAGATRWLVQGDVYRGSLGLLARDDANIAGGNILGRWNRRFSAASDFQAQVYYDVTHRRVPLQFKETRHTFDVDVTQRVQLATRHDVVFGADVLVSEGTDVGTAGFFFDPETRTNTVIGLFAQDEITLTPGRAYLTLGSKFERNDFTGLEMQPTARVRLTVANRQMGWAAVSRAVRLPTRFDTDLRFVVPATGQITLSGSEDFDAEEVVSYEAGYRIRPHARVALDVAAFANRYDDLRSQELPARPGEPVVLANMLNAITSGVEAAGSFQLLDTWRFHTSYAYLTRDFSVDPGSRDPFDGAFEANDPSHLFSMRSFVDLPAGVQLDGVFRAVSRRPTPVVPAYGELDLRVGWIVRPGWDLSFVGQNLLHDRHAELFSTNAPRYAVPRGAYVTSTWRF